MEWPEIDYNTGGYATEDTIKLVLQRAAGAAIADITEDHTKMKPKVMEFNRLLLDETLDWSSDYRDIFEKFVALQAAAKSNEQCLDMAQAGLDTLQDELTYRLDLKTVVPVKDIFVLSKSFKTLETVTHSGTKPLDGFKLEETPQFPFSLTNPVQPSNPEQLATDQIHDDVEPNILQGQHVLRGHDACAQIDKLFQYGVLENSASVLAKSTCMTTNLQSLVTNKVFILLGVTSELGPAKSLLQIEGCTVLGVSRQETPQELVDFVTFNSPDNTNLKLVKGGADLLLQGPQVAQWILNETNVNDELVVCPLATAQGEASVRLAVAMDLIVQRLCRQRPKMTLCQYLSPASIMVAPPSAATNAKQRLEDRPAYERLASKVSMGKWCKPNIPVSNNDYCLVNGIVTALGPEYSLAKLLQQWRCMITYYRDHRIVASPFSPPTKTATMCAIPSIGTALNGFSQFEPLLAFSSSTGSTLMAAVMLSQIQFMNRPLPDMEENPFTLFWDGAVHGGVWNCPYSLESISTINWVLGKTYYGGGNEFPVEALADCARHDLTHQEKTDKRQEKEAMEADLDEDGNPKDKMERAIEILQAGSEFGKPMPDCVKERLEFM